MSVNVDWDYGGKRKVKKIKKEDPFKILGLNQPQYNNARSNSVFSGERREKINKLIGRRLKECRGLGGRTNVKQLPLYRSKLERKEHKGGLTLEKAAKLIGIGIRSLSDYELGKKTIPADLLYRISQVYNKPFDWFFRGITPEMEIFKTEVKRREASIRSQRLDGWFKTLSLEEKEAIFNKDQEDR